MFAQNLADDAVTAAEALFAMASGQDAVAAVWFYAFCLCCLAFCCWFGLGTGIFIGTGPAGGLGRRGCLLSYDWAQPKDGLRLGKRGRWHTRACCLASTPKPLGLRPWTPVPARSPPTRPPPRASRPPLNPPAICYLLRPPWMRGVPWIWGFGAFFCNLPARSADDLM